MHRPAAFLPPAVTPEFATGETVAAWRRVAAYWSAGPVPDLNPSPRSFTVHEISEIDCLPSPGFAFPPPRFGRRPGDSP